MKPVAVAVMVTLVLAGIVSIQAADTPSWWIDDDTFWRFITTFSEPDGKFRYENLLSNEASYQNVIPALKEQPKSSGVYIGIGPEQNFTYIAALEPELAFIVDIRRQNTLEHLLYKALFEMSADRAEFVSYLFSRKRPPGLDSSSSAGALFKAYESQPCDAAMLVQTSRGVEDVLTQQHKFALSDDDQKSIAHILESFCNKGPQIDYGFDQGSGINPPTYTELMTATDGRGQNWSYLANELNFQAIRTMQSKNLILPMTGDFAGGKTLRSIGALVKRRRAVVRAFYVSNVEQYLNPGQSALFRTNVLMLPVTQSSTLIRFIPPETTVLEPVRDFLSKRGALFRLL